MQSKLTLRMDDELIERAKAYSKASGKSVSQLVANYLALLADPPAEEVPLRPVVRSLRGLLLGTGVDESDYRRYLEEKYL